MWNVAVAKMVFGALQVGIVHQVTTLAEEEYYYGPSFAFADEEEFNFDPFEEAPDTEVTCEGEVGGLRSGLYRFAGAYERDCWGESETPRAGGLSWAASEKERAAKLLKGVCKDHEALGFLLETIAGTADEAKANYFYLHGLIEDLEKAAQGEDVAPQVFSGVGGVTSLENFAEAAAVIEEVSNTLSGKLRTCAMKDWAAELASAYKTSLSMVAGEKPEFEAASLQQAFCESPAKLGLHSVFTAAQGAKELVEMLRQVRVLGGRDALKDCSKTTTTPWKPYYDYSQYIM